MVTIRVTYFVYLIVFWLMAAQTPGKALMRLHMTRTGGERLTIRRSLCRALGDWISTLPLFLEFF
jgi:uncharacterized RDD family membrane protein YckC